MTIPQSILTALFCMLVVFAVLIVLWAILRIFSVFFQLLEKRNQQ